MHLVTIQVQGINSEIKQKVMLTCFPFASRLALPSVFTVKMIILSFPFGTTAGPYTQKLQILSADISAGGAEGPEYLGYIWPSFTTCRVMDV